MTFEDLLAARHEDLVRYCLRHAGASLRFESAEDLAQGVHLVALARREKFDLRSESEFDAWLFRLARGHLSDRRIYWSALKRRGGRLLRITASPPSRGAHGAAVGEPFVQGAGPSTFAARREQFVLAVRALSFLTPRDQTLVRWYSEGVPLAEQAVRLDAGYDAVRVGQKRALERFRKSFRLVAR
jgi:RNA polymerase sigma factor (sigma-70 family)